MEGMNGKDDRPNELDRLERRLDNLVRRFRKHRRRVGSFGDRLGRTATGTGDSYERFIAILGKYRRLRVWMGLPPSDGIDPGEIPEDCPDDIGQDPVAQFDAAAEYLGALTRFLELDAEPNLDPQGRKEAGAILIDLHPGLPDEVARLAMTHLWTLAGLLGPVYRRVAAGRGLDRWLGREVLELEEYHRRFVPVVKD
jgi:hypothetical protein